MAYPKFVDIAWVVINETIVDWQESPSLWEREADIQSGLGQRLQLAYKKDGSGIIEHEGARYSRLTCEPPILGIDDSKWVKPDIVIWDNHFQWRQSKSMTNLVGY